MALQIFIRAMFIWAQVRRVARNSWWAVEGQWRTGSAAGGKEVWGRSFQRSTIFMIFQQK